MVPFLLALRENCYQHLDRSSHVLPTFAEYQALRRSARSIAELLALPAEVEFEPADLGHEFFRAATLDD